MAELRVAAEQAMVAPADKGYGVIADYEQHHPRMLPPAFSDLLIERGGVGAGTVISFKMNVGGRTRSFRMQVAEPEPGRVLTESDTESTLVTTFTVTPEGSGSRARIESVWQGARGFGGVMERLFAPRMLQKVYADELALLDEYTRKQAGG